MTENNEQQTPNEQTEKPLSPSDVNKDSSAAQPVEVGVEVRTVSKPDDEDDSDHADGES